MFRTEPEPWRSRAEKIAGAGAATSASSCPGSAMRRRARAPGLTVAYHSACSLQHGQQVTAEPKALLPRAGFTVVEPAEPHICCGSAGTYNMLQPEIAGAAARRASSAICSATEADLIAAGNIGCITQLAGDGMPVVHTVELLDWMAGGPRAVGPASERCLMRRSGRPACHACLCACAACCRTECAPNQATIGAPPSTNCWVR